MWMVGSFPIVKIIRTCEVPSNRVRFKFRIFPCHHISFSDLVKRVERLSMSSIRCDGLSRSKILLQELDAEEG